MQGTGRPGRAHAGRVAARLVPLFGVVQVCTPFLPCGKFFVFLVKLGVVHPSADESFKRDVSGTATIVSPGLPHVLYALLYVQLLPSGRRLAGLRGFGEVLHGDALHNGGYGSDIAWGVDVCNPFLYGFSEVLDFRDLGWVRRPGKLNDTVSVHLSGWFGLVSMGGVLKWQGGNDGQVLASALAPTTDWARVQGAGLSRFTCGVGQANKDVVELRLVLSKGEGVRGSAGCPPRVKSSVWTDSASGALSVERSPVPWPMWG